MHSHLVVAVGECAYRQGVVEVLGVLGVDGECGHIAHVDATGYLFGCYTCVDMVGGLLHIGRIAVGESEFGENGVHLGGVLAGLAQNVDHFAAWILLLVGP